MSESRETGRDYGELDGTEDLFQPDPLNPRMNDSPNPAGDSWSGYAGAYRDAAEKLFEQYAARGVVPFGSLYPVAYLWRQYVELTLKEAERRVRVIKAKRSKCTLTIDEASVRRTHSIGQLWKPVRNFLCTEWPTEPKTKWADRLLKQLSKVDDSSTGFRYPFELPRKTSDEGESPNRIFGEGPAALRGLPTNTVSLHNFDRCMRRLGKYLDYVVGELHRMDDHQS